MMFVGDSLSSNQFESMGCMLHAAVPKSNYSIESRGLLTTIFFKVIIKKLLEENYVTSYFPLVTS